VKSTLRLLVPALVLAAASAHAFGRNKVDEAAFEWRVLRTAHLEIHFYPEEEALARRAADVGEAACGRLDSLLDHELTRRIPVVLFACHEHFRRNHVAPGLVDESTGGFTEIFRRRVVLPYSGSESEFRHVLTHELVHAYMFDRLYGRGVKSLFIRQYAIPIPLWFGEGLAEYLSNRWDSESEMALRDAAVSGALPPFDRIAGGWIVYKAGWSAIAWLVERFGDDVLRKILDDLPETRDLALTIRNVTGEDAGKLGAEWLEAVRRRTWPTIAFLDRADRHGRVLAKGEPGTADMRPVLSPDGTRLAFVSSRDGTPDLFVAAVGESSLGAPRVLVRGERSGAVESLHPMRASVGFSPDGKLIAAAAATEGADALLVLEASTGRTIFRVTPPLDALERPDWSPTEERLVFTGMVGGQVDLFAVDVDGARFTRLTDDLFEERGPRFTADGRAVLFASDRSDSTGIDLFRLDLATREVSPVVAAPGDQWDVAVSGDGRTVYYVSDERGTRDVWARDLATGATRRLTKLVGGADSPSAAAAGARLAFAAYEDGTYDVVVVDDPDTLDAGDAPPIEMRASPPPAAPPGAASAAPVDVVLDSYHPRFRPEWITGSFGFGGYGVAGGVATTITDVVGQHRLSLGASFFRSIDDADLFASYTYLPRRIDWGVSAFRVRDFLHDGRTTLGHPIGEETRDAEFSERLAGASVSAAYPFDLFRRVEADFAVASLERTRETDTSTVSTRSLLFLPRVAHSFDNALYGWTGPVQGSRSVVSVQHSIPLGGDRLDFGTALADLRRYVRRRDYVLAARLSAATSFGADPQEFQLGGSETLRGYERAALRGKSSYLASLEFRYPFIEYVRLGWPFRSAFGGVRGNLFVDAGAVDLDAAHVGFGVGTRMRFAYLPIRVDVGWATDGRSVGAPVWDFAIGPEF
jgi:Tol biopolymer transport system component